MPIGVDPNSRNQPDVNRQLTEAIRQLVFRLNDIDSKIKTLQIRANQMELSIDYLKTHT